MQSGIKPRSMMTNQRGDQRRRKFHVYIGAVCLFRIIYNSSNIYRGWHRRKNARGQRCSREDGKAQKARKQRQKHRVWIMRCSNCKKIMDLSDVQRYNLLQFFIEGSVPSCRKWSKVLFWWNVLPQQALSPKSCLKNHLTIFPYRVHPTTKQGKNQYDS